MEITDLLLKFEHHAQLKKLDAWFASSSSNRIWIKGLAGSFKSVLFSTFFASHRQSFLFVLNDMESAAYFYHDLVQITGGADVLFFPSSYKRAMKYGEKDSANEVMRNETLDSIQHSESPLMVVTYPESVFERVISSADLNAKSLSLKTSQKIKISAVTYILHDFGFEKVDFVSQPGEYAVRGSVLDIFSYANEYPFRLDFFGDEIDSIRTFDVESQLSKDKKERISVVSDVNGKDSAAVSLFDFIPKDMALAFSDFDFTLDRMRQLEEENEGIDNVLKSADFQSQTEEFRLIEFGLHNHFRQSAVLSFSAQPQPIFHKNFDLVISNFIQMKENGYEVFVMTDNTHQTDRLQAIIEDKNQAAPFVPVSKTLHEGFVDDELHLCCYTDHQIFDRFHKYSLTSDRVRQGKAALSMKALRELQVGDYVVHIDFGIGRFGGLLTMDINGKKQEVIKLIYRDDDLVFISIHSLHKISKFRSKDGEEPKINKLGTGTWQALKDRTKKKVKDIARDLIALYARRRDEKGFAYSPDSYMQQELESSFIYEDTPDQLKATTDVKRDMEEDEPMDRLICGDVGFGKTEIAIRAAFKAVADNKQVAVLVPTTVLAFQHFQTFTERLKNFPCRVDYLSRTRTVKDAHSVIKDLAAGNIDIIIGTHKLIGKTVKFKDLGLLIIDEEQKFGVSVKEKIRQMKVNVDTLTMTATPIPRTLQFSLLGARDMSIISTPPPNRYPVQTELCVFNEEVIRDAIKFELDRNGQVFFVNNRIQNLQALKELINRLVPEARVVIGHGQMPGEQLERVILDFLNYDYDVLLSTTIIESGIDISNCNTIIINDAQNYGLSDLHQLRGRVGRSNRRAFCYLLSPPLSSMSDESRRRLETIESFSQLGSGFNIAMQDLDIRGAGNLLGAEQSGFIADLGYETYHKILNEAVDELKENEFSDLYAEEEKEKLEQKTFVTDCQMETDMELMFPAEYISNVAERMSLYRELDSVQDEAALKQFENNLTDRFGALPEQAQNLLQLVRLRWQAIALGFEKVVLKNNHMTGFFIASDSSPYFQSKSFGLILDYLEHNAFRCQFKQHTDKKAIVFNDIPSIQSAMEVLTSILQKKEAVL